MRGGASSAQVPLAQGAGRTLPVAVGAEGLRIAVVASRYNLEISQRLVKGALEELERLGADMDEVVLVWVPGAFELPLAAVTLARAGAVDAVVCLGSVIRGETDHYDHVAREASSGLSRVQLETGLPVTFGVLTTDNVDQALDRSGGSGGDKGAESAATAVEMARLIEVLGGHSG